MDEFLELTFLFFFSGRYINTIQQLKQLIAMKMNEPNPETREELSKNIEKLTKSCIRKYNHFQFIFSLFWI